MTTHDLDMTGIQGLSQPTAFDPAEYLKLPDIIRTLSIALAHQYSSHRLSSEALTKALRKEVASIISIGGYAADLVERQTDFCHLSNYPAHDLLLSKVEDTLNLMSTCYDGLFKHHISLCRSVLSGRAGSCLSDYGSEWQTELARFFQHDPSGIAAIQSQKDALGSLVISCAFELGQIQDEATLIQDAKPTFLENMTLALQNGAGIRLVTKISDVTDDPTLSLLAKLEGLGLIHKELRTQQENLSDMRVRKMGLTGGADVSHFDCGN